MRTILLHCVVNLRKITRYVVDGIRNAPHMRSLLIGLVDKYENITEESDALFLSDWDDFPDSWEDNKNLK